MACAVSNCANVRLSRAMPIWIILLVPALSVALSGQPQTCCELMVHVTTTDAPVEGAAIQVVDRQGGLIASATTDGLGDARLSLRPGWYLVRASAPGHIALLGGRFATESVTLAAEEASLRLWLVPQGTPSTSADETAAPIVYGAIRGIVRDQEGHPIAGAKVEVTGHRVGMVRSGRTITGEDGRYRVVVPIDTYSVMASKGSPHPPVT